MFDLLTIIGPTASGKTALATAVAKELGAEIISADSRQVYRGMDLGTGKDLSEYLIDGVQIPFHLIDIVDAGTKYNLFEYQEDFKKVWNSCQQRGVYPILCGGSGLYVESVLKGYRLLPVPENKELRHQLEKFSLYELEQKLKSFKNLHNQTEIDTAKRAIRAIEIEEYYSNHEQEAHDFPQINSLIIGIDIDREIRRERITKRLYQRFEEGMLDEVRGLLASGIAAEDLIYYGLEYKFMTQYLIGEISYQEMFDRLNVAIHQFAKRQMTWFRKMERDGFTIHWIDGTLPMNEKVEQVMILLNQASK